MALAISTKLDRYEIRFHKRLEQPKIWVTANPRLSIYYRRDPDSKPS